MKETIKNFIVTVLVCACIIWIVSFDPSQFQTWFTVAICLGSATVFFWRIFDFGNQFIEDNDERV